MDKLYRKLKKYSVTPTQYFILKELSLCDCSVTKLAEIMQMSTITVQQHVSNLRKRLKVNTNIGLIVKAHKIGLININEDDEDE